MNERTDRSASDPVAEALGQILAKLETIDQRLTQVEADQQRVSTQGLPMGRPPVPPSEGNGPTAVAEPSAPTDERRGTMSRRNLITGGVTALGAAGVVALASATPAAAANGDAVVAGASTSASSATTVTGNVPNTATLAAVNTATGNAAGLYASAGGSANIGGFGAVVGDAASQPGVTGLSGSGTGVVAKSTSSYAVFAQTTSGETGIYSRTSTNLSYGAAIKGQAIQSPASGVLGINGSSGIGVSGFSDSGIGVNGKTTSGTALKGVSDNGFGLEVSAPRAQLRLTSLPARTAPTEDTSAHVRGDVVVDGAGILWFCTADGTPGTWRRLAGGTAAGAFHPLPSPVRIYDSRPGSVPFIGSKTSLSGNAARTIDTTANNSLVPVGATAVTMTVLLVNAANGNGNVTIWANGTTRPQANAMVWGTGSGRYCTMTTTAVDAAAKIQIAASASTDVVLDVIGYYR